MGIIRAATSAIGGGLADQYLEAIVPADMGETTVMVKGVQKSDKRNQNKKGSPDIITDGSVIHVGVNQFMILVDGGKIIDFSAEPGYYTVDNKSAPSLFNGDFGEAVKETFGRVKYGGISPQSQQVYYINTQEINNIPFGTVNPVNYFDDFYNAELYLRCHGYFSIRIIDPLKFFTEAIPRNASKVDIQNINKLYLAEFLTALQTSLNQMSVDGLRISHVTSKSRELAKYMTTVLDEEWNARRGMIIESVGISSLSYDEESKKLINMRNQGAMLSDASVREGYVQGSVARGIEAAGSNSAGSMQGFMGVGMGMQSGGNFMASASASNQEQMRQQNAAKEQSATAQEPSDAWTCTQCNAKNSGGKFCAECGGKRPQGKFCMECGSALTGDAKFCSACGNKVG